MMFFGRIFGFGRQHIAKEPLPPKGEFKSHREFIGRSVGVLNACDMMIERATNTAYRHCALGKIKLK